MTGECSRFHHFYFYLYYPEYQNRTNDYIFVGYTFMSDFVRLRGQIEVCFSKDPSTPCIYLCMHISMSEQQKFLFYERGS